MPKAQWILIGGEAWTGKSTCASVLIDLGETAAAVVVQTLAQRPFDCILIGAGIRGLPQHTRLFEQVINAVHEHAPAAKLCFNTNPNDIAEAVLRWINA